MRHMKIKRVIAIVLLLTVAGVAGFGGTGDSPSHSATRSPVRYELVGHTLWVLATFLDWPLTMPSFGEESDLSSQPAVHLILTKTGNNTLN